MSEAVWEPMEKRVVLLATFSAIIFKAAGFEGFTFRLGSAVVTLVATSPVQAESAPFDFL